MLDFIHNACLKLVENIFLRKSNNGFESPWHGKTVHFTSRYDMSGMYRDTSLDAATKEIERNRNKIKAILKHKKEEKHRLKMTK